jgi:serine/threonine protein kinase
MAEIYCAKVIGAEAFQRQVAIKCMLAHLAEDKSIVNMFVDEAKVLALLNHPNIVQIIALERLEGQLYIIMEMVYGFDLRHILQQQIAHGIEPDIGFTLYVISKAAEGLDYAHRFVGIDGRALNLIHRDISPQNILVGFDGQVKITDFGIAKSSQRRVETQAGILKGKFAYMAPEQILGKRIDHRVDIFALGILLFEMLTQTSLFQGDSDMAILESIRSVHLPDFARFLPVQAQGLVPILTNALAKEPNQRYLYAQDMQKDLHPWLNKFGYGQEGPQKAIQFMRQLYADILPDLQIERKQFDAVTVEDCVETIAWGDEEPTVSKLSQSEVTVPNSKKAKKTNALSFFTPAARDKNSEKVLGQVYREKGKALERRQAEEALLIETMTQTSAKWWWFGLRVFFFSFVCVVGGFFWILSQTLSPQAFSTLRMLSLKQMKVQIEKARSVASSTLKSFGAPMEKKEVPKSQKDFMNQEEEEDTQVAEENSHEEKPK